MSNNDKDLVRLNHIADAVGLIVEFTSGIDSMKFSENKMIQAAVVREFEIIGEASKNISEETQNRFIHIQWRLMRDFRNLLIHEYFMVDLGEVWATVKNDIPALQEQIQEVIKFIEKENKK